MFLNDKLWNCVVICSQRFSTTSFKAMVLYAPNFTWRQALKLCCCMLPTFLNDKLWNYGLVCFQRYSTISSETMLLYAPNVSWRQALKLCCCMLPTLLVNNLWNYVVVCSQRFSTTQPFSHPYFMLFRLLKWKLTQGNSLTNANSQ